MNTIELQKTRAAEPLTLYGTAVTSRLLLGTAQYPSPQVLADAVKASRAEVVTVSVRRESAGGSAGQRFWELIRSLGVRVLPNTAGCRTPKEAITTAQMIASTSSITMVVCEEPSAIKARLAASSVMAINRYRARLLRISASPAQALP